MKWRGPGPEGRPVGWISGYVAGGQWMTDVALVGYLAAVLGAWAMWGGVAAVAVGTVLLAPFAGVVAAGLRESATAGWLAASAVCAAGVVLAAALATGGADSQGSAAGAVTPAQSPERFLEAASRSADRPQPPVVVPAEAAWDLREDDALLADLQAWSRQVEEVKAAEERQRTQRAAAQAQTRAPGPGPGSPPSVGSVKEYAAGRVGGGEQWGCLEALWQKESGWNHRAANPSSSAYGIPQALPGSKMASAGADWRTNPITQVDWGLSYIEGRYGTPCKAWAHSQARNWY